MNSTNIRIELNEMAHSGTPYISPLFAHCFLDGARGDERLPTLASLTTFSAVTSTAGRLTEAGDLTTSACDPSVAAFFFGDLTGVMDLSAWMALTGDRAGAGCPTSPPFPYSAMMAAASSSQPARTGMSG